MWIKSGSGESLEGHGHPGEQLHSIVIGWRELGAFWGSSVDGRGTWSGEGSSRAWLLRQMKAKAGQAWLRVGGSDTERS